MLYFTKLNVVLTYCFIIFISFFTFSNFSSNENNLINKKINLGLDLQGGSYLLLEMDIGPIVLQKLQNKLIPLKKNLINNKIKFKNIVRDNREKFDRKDILNLEKNFNEFVLDRGNLGILDFFRLKKFAKETFG